MQMCVCVQVSRDYYNKQWINSVGVDGSKVKRDKVGKEQAKVKNLHDKS